MVDPSNKNHKIVMDIFEDLAEDGEKTITALSHDTKYHFQTLKSYLDLIEFIQEQPKLVVRQDSKQKPYSVSLEKN